MTNLPNNLTYILYILNKDNEWKEIYRIDIKTIKIYNVFCNGKIKLEPKCPKDFGDFLSIYNDYTWKIEKFIISNL